MLTGRRSLWRTLGLQSKKQGSLDGQALALSLGPRYRRVRPASFLRYRRAPQRSARCLPRQVVCCFRCSVSHDINLAMGDAFSKTAHLHRDISISNIILVRERGRCLRRGYLIDWDSCCPANESQEATETGRAVGSILSCPFCAIFYRLLTGNMAVYVASNVECNRAHG